MRTELETLLASDKLPTLPAVAVRIIELVQRPEPDFQQLAATIKSDPAISGKLLKTANSALLGVGRAVSSIDEAIPRLGTTLVRTLVLGFTLPRPSHRSADVKRHYQLHWRRSLTQAVAAESLAMPAHGLDHSVFFTAGLMQDIGVMALLHCRCDESAVTEVARVLGNPAMEVEQFGLHHVDVSTGLCRKWKLDADLIQAIGGHHDRVESVSIDNSVGKLRIGAIVASWCADYLNPTRTGTFVDRSELEATIQRQFAIEDDLDSFLREVLARVNEVAALFDFDIGEMRSAEEILDRAKTTMERFAVQAQLETMSATQKAEAAVRQIAELKSQQERWRDEAERDPLTGLLNRRYLASDLDQQFRDWMAHGSTLGCLFLDIDNFKVLNDTFGHDVGDEALVQVARILRQAVRKADVVVRYGGDEFLVILQDVSENQLSRIANRICRRIQICHLPSQARASITSSIGAVFVRPKDDFRLTFQDVVRSVDQAMYHAKQAGGNQVHLSKPHYGTIGSAMYPALPSGLVVPHKSESW